MSATRTVSRTSKTNPPPDKARTLVAPGRELLSRPELAAVLGVSTQTLHRWTARRMIPFLRFAKRFIRYDLARVKAALAEYELQEVGARR
jgi:DNA-binding XRE family transcriptional regulator